MQETCACIYTSLVADFLSVSTPIIKLFMYRNLNKINDGDSEKVRWSNIQLILLFLLFLLPLLQYCYYIHFVFAIAELIQDSKLSQENEQELEQYVFSQ